MKFVTPILLTLSAFGLVNCGQNVDSIDGSKIANASGSSKIAGADGVAHIVIHCNDGVDYTYTVEDFKMLDPSKICIKPTSELESKGSISSSDFKFETNSISNSYGPWSAKVFDTEMFTGQMSFDVVIDKKTPISVSYYSDGSGATASGNPKVFITDGNGKSWEAVETVTAFRKVTMPIKIEYTGFNGNHLRTAGSLAMRVINLKYHVEGIAEKHLLEGKFNQDSSKKYIKTYGANYSGMRAAFKVETDFFSNFNNSNLCSNIDFTDAKGKKVTFNASLRSQRLDNMVLPITVHSYLSCFSTLAAKPENPTLDYAVRLTAVKLASADAVNEISAPTTSETPRKCQDGFVLAFEITDDESDQIPNKCDVMNTLVWEKGDRFSIEWWSTSGQKFGPSIWNLKSHISSIREHVKNCDKRVGGNDDYAMPSEDRKWFLTIVPYNDVQLAITKFGDNPVDGSDHYYGDLMAGGKSNDEVHGVGFSKFDAAWQDRFSSGDGFRICVEKK